MALIIIAEVRAMLPGFRYYLYWHRSLAVVQFLLEGEVLVIGVVRRLS